MKDIVVQRDQTSVCDQGKECGMEMAAVGQRREAQDGGAVTGQTGWAQTEDSLWDRGCFLRME